MPGLPCDGPTIISQYVKRSFTPRNKFRLESYPQRLNIQTLGNIALRLVWLKVLKHSTRK